MPNRPASPDLITAGTYPFTSASGVALEDMSSGTTQLVGPSLDDTASAVTNIGFDFWYDGARTTQFSINANGLMRLGPTVVSTSFNNGTDFANVLNAPKIAPYYEDLCTGTTGKVHYKVVGTAPDRKLVVEWLNMKISRDAGCTTPVGNGTFQAWLHESAGSTSPGRIEFVYGALPAPAVVDAGYTVGLQSGAATNLASVTTVGPTVSYTTANNTQMDAIGAGTAYRFTPNVPAAPTNLTFSGVGATVMTLGWNDNATNELGYAIYQSTDGVNYAFATQTAANATSQLLTGLSPSTTYHFRIFAVTEGAQSSALSGSQATRALMDISCAPPGGNWSSPATWAGGVVPGGDNVTIPSGCAVTLDTDAFAQNLTIDSGGTLETPATGSDVRALRVSGNLTNNGVLDLSTNGGLAGAGITFAGAANNTFGGTGATTDIRSITLNKGSSSANILELNPSNFTLHGGNTDGPGGYLTLLNGTFKISGSFSMTNRTFNTAGAYTIPLTGGIWLNNANYVVAATASAATTSNNGLFRVTQGVYNIGIGAGDQMRAGTGAAFTIEGGTVNVSGAFDPQNPVIYTQTAGALNVGVVGNNVSNFGTFELFSAAVTGAFNMSGGTINVINPSTGATKVDYRNNTPTAQSIVTGGTVVIGAAGAPASSIYTVSGRMPSTIVNTTQTMRVNNATVNLRGSALMNDGVIDFTGVNARYDFTAVGPMTYGGSGVFGTTVTPFGGVGVSSNSLSPITLNAPIVANRINLFTGGFVNSNQITLGNGGASTTVVQIGSVGLTTPGGSFDVSPVHNQGTGGQILLYAPESTPRTTGVEVNPTRQLTSINLVDNINGVTIAGGDLTLNSTAAALVLTNGRLITGANTLSLSSGTATVTRTNGFVDGNFRKTYAAVASKTFEVGTASGYSPVLFNVTAGTFPATVTAKAIQGAHPNFTDPTLALQRYWNLTAAGVTADLTFNYLTADIPGTANENNFVIFKYDGLFSQPGGTVNPATNQATITGVTAFSDWTVAEPGAIGPPPPPPPPPPPASASASSASAATSASTASATTPTATSATTTAGLRRRSHDSGRSRGG